jgi:hypothetical protein
MMRKIFLFRKLIKAFRNRIHLSLVRERERERERESVREREIERERMLSSVLTLRD